MLGCRDHIHGGNTILDGDAQLILGQVHPSCHMNSPSPDLHSLLRASLLPSSLNQHFWQDTTLRYYPLLLQTYANLEERSPKDAYYMPAQADRCAIAHIPFSQPSIRGQMIATGVLLQNMKYVGKAGSRSE